MSKTFTTPENRELAYDYLPGTRPGIVFLGGFRSDKEGTKAIFLENFARTSGRAFLRFDYSGHGASSGDFLDGSIGDWFEDARAIISSVTDGTQVLVGSSMGGWISLLVARAMPEKVAALVTIAAAPDFTQAMEAAFSEEEVVEMAATDRVSQPSDYSDEPYIITRRLIEDGKNQLVLDRPLNLDFPTRFLQGTADADVDQSVALNLLDHAEGDDIRLTLVKGADHRFSSDACLSLIKDAINEVTALAAEKQ